MRAAILAVAAGVLLGSAWSLLEGTPAAEARTYYPWCARYSGRDSPGVPVCGFKTFQQCVASVHGRGGFCEQNWPPPEPRRR